MASTSAVTACDVALTCTLAASTRALSTSNRLIVLPFPATLVTRRSRVPRTREVPRASSTGPPYAATVSMLIDPPLWPAHGMLWSHLVSDRSLAELHAFAGANGIPTRAFDLDHYDVPDHAHADLVAAGAVPVGAKDLLRRLRASGLRITAAQRAGRAPG